MSNDNRWTARPTAAHSVTAAVFILPVLLGVLAGWQAVVILDAMGLAALATSLVATVLVVSVTQRLTRRLLPLATLLHLDLPFPGTRPSRFAVALKAGSTRNLQRLIDEQPESDAADGAVTILAFAAALSRHDRGTRGHSERVRALVDLIGTELGLPPDDRDCLRWAALLHDVGKLGVHHDVLNKLDPLTDEDWHALLQHPVEGARLAKPLRGFLGDWVDSVEHHHERWDGKGYPHGLSGEDIAYGARIVAVADVYEVMTSKARNYRTPVTSTAAQRELLRVAGSQLDPTVVKAFLGVNQKEVRRAMNVAAIALQLPALLRWRTPLRVGSPAGGDPLETLGDTPSDGSVPRTGDGLHARHPDASMPDVSMSHPDAGDGQAGDSGNAGDTGAIDDL